MPAISVKPRGVTGPVGGEEAATLPLRVISAATLNVLVRLISFAAHISILPLVVVMSASGVVMVLLIFTSPPAANKTLPPVLGMATEPFVVIAAFTLMSRPQHTTRLPLMAVIGALMLTSPAASNVNVVGFVGDQEIGDAMVMSPRPDGGVPGALPLFVVVIVMSVPMAPTPNAVERVLASTVAVP